MNKQTRLIQNSLPLIAAGLGDKMGIRVTVSGNQAYTDGKTINVPDFVIQNKEQKDAVLGFMAHEAAHIKFDSFSAIHRANSIVVKNYWNIFEDMRIENAMIGAMAGSKKWINQIWINRQLSGSRPVVTKEHEPSVIIDEFLLMTCRVKYRNQTHLQPYLDAAEGAFCMVFGYKLFIALTQLLEQELPQINTSNQAFDLAENVLNLISNFDPEDDDQDSNSQSSDEGDSDSQSNAGDANSQPASEEVIAAIQAAISSCESFDDMEVFAKSMTLMANNNPEQTRAKMPVSEDVKPIPASANDLLQSVNSTSSQITAKLQAIVEQDMKVRCKTKTSGLSINSKVLHRHAVNDARLFKQKGKKKQIDTIVELCLDNSGSMRSRNLIGTAIETQLALAKALTRFNGVSVTASAFPIRNCDDTVLNLLNEGESVNKLAMRYYQVNADGGSTPTASALLHCLRKVLNSQKRNKVIIIVTDGYPDNEQQEDLTRLVRMAEASGVTVIGVALGAIASDKGSFYKYFQNALFIQDVKELKNELFKLAKNILIAQ